MSRARLAFFGLFAVVWLSAIAAFFVYDALPFMDLPAHAGLIALRERLGHSPFEDRFYLLDAQFGPYSLFRGLGALFARLTHPIMATRVLGAAGPAFMPFAIATAQRRAFGAVDPAVLFLGVALSFGLMTIFGFASYILALAWLVVLVGELLRLATQQETPAPRQWLLLAAGFLLLLFAHGHAFLLALGALAIVIARSPKRRLALALAAAPSVLMAAAASVAARGAGGPNAPHVAQQLHFLDPLDKLSLLVTPTLTTRMGVDIAAGLLVWGVLLVGLRASARHSSRHLTTSTVNYCLLALCLLFVLSPHDIGWFGFADGRVVLAIALTLAVGTDPAALPVRVRKWRMALAAIAAVAVVASVHVASRGFQREARAYREALAQVKPNKRVFYLPLDADSQWFTGHPFLHYDKLLLVSQPELVNDIWFHQGSAVYPRAAHPQTPLPSLKPNEDLRALIGPSDWDYVLVKTVSGSPKPPLPPFAHLAFAENGWWVFTIANPAAPADSD